MFIVVIAVLQTTGSSFATGAVDDASDQSPLRSVERAADGLKPYTPLLRCFSSISIVQPTILERKHAVIGKARYLRETALGQGACKGDSFVFSRAVGRLFLAWRVAGYFCFPQPFAFLQQVVNAYLLL